MWGSLPGLRGSFPAEVGFKPEIDPFWRPLHCKAWLQFEDREPERLICITEFEVEILLDLITVDPDLQEPDVEELPETEEGEVVPSLAMVTHGKHQVSPKLEEFFFVKAIDV